MAVGPVILQLLCYCWFGGLVLGHRIPSLIFTVTFYPLLLSICTDQHRCQPWWCRVRGGCDARYQASKHRPVLWCHQGPQARESVHGADGRWLTNGVMLLDVTVALFYRWLCGRAAQAGCFQGRCHLSLLQAAVVGCVLLALEGCGPQGLERLVKGCQQLNW